MRTFVLVLLLASLGSSAQPLVLIHKMWKEPVALAAVTEEPVNNQFFPVYKSDLDSLIQLTQWFIDVLEQSGNHLALNEIKKVGGSTFIAQTSYSGSVPKFRLNLLTRCGQAGYSMTVVTEEDSQKKRLQKMHAFLDYLRNNRFLVEEAPQ